MADRAVPAGTGQGPALQRVVVHVAVRSRGELVLVPDARGVGREVLPWAVLAHGESPAAAAARVLGALSAPPVRTGAPLEVRDALRCAEGGETPGYPGGVGLHTVHVVLAAEITDHAARGTCAPGWRWVLAPPRFPLVADEHVDVTATELRRLLAPPAGAGVAVLRQRLACYAVVVSPDARILLTRLSTSTPSPGRWTLPGGGVDHGEHPVDAAVREVHEESGMRVVVDRLVDIGSEHFTGRSPRGVLEDFHAVRILVTATALEVREPEVLDLGGSTDLAQWVPLDAVSGLGLVGVAHRGVQIALRHRGGA